MTTNTPAPAQEAEFHLNELLRLTQPWPGATIPCATVRSHVEQALSKLRAPVADERAANPHIGYPDLADAWQRGFDGRTPGWSGLPRDVFDATYQEGKRARAALASAQVDEPETMDEIHRREREHAPWVLPKDPTIPVSAPVAGEAQKGWRLVPEKLTEEMRTAGEVVRSPSGTVSYGLSRHALALAWDALLSAAPSPPATHAAPQASDAVREQSAAFPARPLGVFCAGKWTLSGTGQAFSHTDLDEAAFVAYRDALSAQPGAQKNGGGDAN